MRIPLTIQMGSGSQLQGETTSVSKHGASIRIATGEALLACGDSLQVTLRSNRQAQSARVVWVDKGGTHLCAIELEQASDFWGVRFPGASDEGWRPSPKPSPDSKTEEPPASELSTPATQTAAPAVVVYPLSTSESSAAVPAREQDCANPTATITGLSAVHSLLAEKVQVVSSSPSEATVLLCHLVEPGTRLRLFLTKDQAVLARVISISDQREAGKWRVRVRYETN